METPVLNDAAFRVLGPLEVTLRGRPLPVSGKQRIVLATLLLQANRTVPVDELGERLWDAAPVDVRGGVQKYVMRLRRALAELAPMVRTESDGYRIEVGPEQLDLDRFDELVERGERASAGGDTALASELLAEAVALWRNLPPLSNVASPTLARDEVPRLVERYLHAQERRIDAELELGRFAEVGSTLVPLIRDHPLRERFWVQRMRALYETGRQAEAMEAYRTIARLLVDELGVDPGAELRELYQRILQGGALSPRVTTRSHVPRQLPMPPAGVVGRKREITAVTATLGAADPDIPRIVVVTGAAGVGKTAVALHAAHELAGMFPDGQIFAELGANAVDGTPAVEDTLGHMVRSLGAAPEAVPRHRRDLVALYRTLTSGRRLLVVLDDTAGEDELRMLLPATTTSAVVVTSRRETPGLFVAPGAELVAVNRLDVDHAREVLVRAIGPDRAAEGSAVVDELAVLCDGLPLALRIAAAHLVARPHLSVTDYVADLRTRGVLTALRFGTGQQASVESAIDASYRRLPAADQRLLRSLSRSPFDAVSRTGAAELAGLPVAVVTSGLDRLAQLNLVARRSGSEYRLDPLTREFAARRNDEGDESNRSMEA